MPELPEVETVVRDLRPELVDRILISLKTSDLGLRRPWQPSWRKSILGRTVARIDRRGKWILIDLNGPRLVIHLGMTGQLTVASKKEPPQNHTHLLFDLNDGRQLRFRDIRRFGSASLFNDQAGLEAFFVEQALGPEPFDIERGYWNGCFEKTRRNLKAILLDQSVVAGVGNIYADESLFEAGLHPGRLGHTLETRERDRLRRAVPKVLTRAIEKRGSTIRDYVGGSGLQGGFQDEFKVYGRTGEPCRRCEVPIERHVFAGRSSHVCPRCQPQAAILKK